MRPLSCEVTDVEEGSEIVQLGDGELEVGEESENCRRANRILVHELN